MSISSVSASNYASVNAASATLTYAENHNDTGSSNSTTSFGPDVVVTFSDEAFELMQLREISNETAKQFTDILARANAANASEAPKDFLNTLSSSDMEVLRQVHCLADPINISSLTNEGAANLLVQPGSARDLDNNGLTTIGAANMFTFPPENAPESFKAAWAFATEGMSLADIPTQMIFAAGLANIHCDPTTGEVTTVEPGDPNWRNPYADPNYDYKGAVSDIMDALTSNYQHGGMSEEQYQNDMDFYLRLSQAMG
jgi:hypothetical protein